MARYQSSRLYQYSTDDDDDDDQKCNRIAVKYRDGPEMLNSVHCAIPCWKNDSPAVFHIKRHKTRRVT